MLASNDVPYEGQSNAKMRDCDAAADPPPQRKIIHVDMDDFYASVEQRDNPELRGKPVAVGGSQARGVVAAASYEARKFGVRSAMPSVTAKRKCPDLIFVKPRFDVYKEASRQIRAIFAEYTRIVEPLSLDEAYLDVTENLKGIASATQIAEEIRARIPAETGLTASAGVSYNEAEWTSEHGRSLSSSSISGSQDITSIGSRVASTTGPSAPIVSASRLALRTLFPTIFSPAKRRATRSDRLSKRSGAIARALTSAAAP